jgi:hypothetical protein
MKKILAGIQQNKVFKFASSVKMAVLVMLLLGAVVAVGTIYESRYNAQVAGLMVYRTPWFLALLCLLWINIFSAAVSRIPYKRRHTGFVVTHLGMLTLLIGSGVTYLYGLDGQLFVQEGSRSRVVELTDLAIRTARDGSNEVHIFPFARSLSRGALKNDDFSLLTGLSIQEYLPAATRKGEGGGMGGSGAPGLTVSFGLKSQFFDVSETLHSSSKPEMQMGPARIRLVEESGAVSVAESQKENKKGNQREKIKEAVAPGATLVVLNAKTGKIMAEWPLSLLRRKSQMAGNVGIILEKEFAKAIVSNNHLVEGDNPNPALEIRLTKDGKEAREIVFQKHPSFSLSPEGFYGLRLMWGGKGESVMGEEAVSSSLSTIASEPQDRSGNVIEFHVNKNQLDRVHLQLFKNNQSVLQKELKKGETAETPWMGMKITLGDLAFVEGGGTAPASEGEVMPIEIPFRSPLPRSALRVGGQWLMEGESRHFLNGNENIEVYYGLNSVEIPFDIQLHKFEKVDYPGTETAMSFQSMVSVNDESTQTLIRMNEPLIRDDYIIYQSSYILNPNQKPVSIFSVNKDPGRTLKYIGAVILVLGIFLFIVMRTKWYLKRFAGAA